MAKNTQDAIEKDLARFEHKGPGIKPMVRGDEKVFDIMESEFRPYQLHGEVEGNEEEFLRVGRDARDARLVGNQNGQVYRAVGSLQDGTGYLVDQHGRPINRTQQAPITPMPRRSKDW